jgi:hypothetical protein
MDIGKIGTPVGVTPGVTPLNQDKKEEAPAPPADRVEIGAPKKHKRNAAEKLFSTLMSGVGLGSGAAGGGIIGASVASATNLVSGLLAHNVTLTALTAAGLTGGAVGAVIFGVAGMYGGWKVGEWVTDGVRWVYNKITAPPGK